MKKLLVILAGLVLIAGTAAFAANTSSRYNYQGQSASQRMQREQQNGTENLERKRQEYMRKIENEQRKNGGKKQANYDMIMRR